MTCVQKIAMAAVACLMIVQTTAAQNQEGQIDITPFIGVLVPTNDVVESNAFSAGSEAAKHEVDLMPGGKLTYWFRSEWGVELELLYAPNAIESNAFNIPGTVDAQFLTLSGRLVYDFGTDPAKPAFLLTGGLGFFATTYDDPLDMTTGGMGLVGLGLRIPLSEAIAFRVDLTDYITTARWEIPGGGKTDKLLQNDLTVTGGLTFSFNN